MGKKLLQWHLETENTAICKGCENEEVHSLTKSVFDEVHYKGLGALEVKYDRKRGKYYIIEPTVGRNDLQSFIAVMGGVNLTKIAFFDLHNRQESIVKDQNRGGYWVHENHTQRALVSLFTQHKFPYRALLNYLKNPQKIYGAYFYPKDMRPFFSLYIQKIRRKIRRIFKKS